MTVLSRAGRRDDLVPEQQHPARQGDLRHHRHGTSGKGSPRSNGHCSSAAPPHDDDTTTWHWRETDPMATYLATISIGQYDVVTRHARNRGVRSGPTSIRDRRRSRRPQGRHGRRLLGEAVRPLSVHVGRRHRRQRPVSATPSRCRRGRCFPYVPGISSTARPRARPPVVRRLGDTQGLERHLAERGLRDVRRVAVAGALSARILRTPLPQAVRRPTAELPFWDIPVGQPASRPTCSRSRSTPGRNGAAGAPDDDRDCGLLHADPAVAAPNSAGRRTTDSGHGREDLRTGLNVLFHAGCTHLGEPPAP